MGLYEKKSQDLKISYLIRPWLTSELKKKKKTHTHRHCEINAQVKTVHCDEDIRWEKKCSGQKVLYLLEEKL